MALEDRATYTLVGPDGKPYESAVKGALGGWRGGNIYGGLDCRSALNQIARGHDIKERLFFKDAQTAIAAGYRPCKI